MRCVILFRINFSDWRKILIKRGNFSRGQNSKVILKLRVLRIFLRWKNIASFWNIFDKTLSFFFFCFFLHRIARKRRFNIAAYFTHHSCGNKLLMTSCRWEMVNIHLTIPWDLRRNQQNCVQNVVFDKYFIFGYLSTEFPLSIFHH